MSKDIQKIALLILIPMIIFSYITTVASHAKSKTIDDHPEDLVYEYFECTNNNDVDSISKLLYNSKDVDRLSLKFNEIDKVSLVSISEEMNSSLVDAYTKYNPDLYENNVKIYKVKYQIYYNKESYLYDKNGIYDSWCFLVKDSSTSKWYIDIFDI